MASSGLQQAAKVLGAAGLFGVTSLIGSPIAGAVVTGIGGPVLEVVSQQGIDYLVEHWPSRKGALNHDLHIAMQLAFARATARLETQWQETDYAKRLTKDQRDPIATFFDTFKKDIAWVFSEEELPDFAAGIKALNSNRAAKAEFQRVIDEQLRRYLRGNDDTLYHFMRARLVAEAALCFMEELKTNDRAWRAWQMLLNEGLQAGLNESLRKQDQLAANVARLTLMLEDLRAQRIRLSSTPEDRRDPWGEAALLWIHDRLARQIEEEARRTRETVQDEGEHTRDAVRDEGEHTRATVVEGNAEIKEGIRGLELTLTSLVKRGASSTAGELLQPATDRHRRIWNVPHSRNPNFTGRDAWLDVLTAAKGPARTPLAHAIIGMGGVGKSQLAAEFAYRSGNDFTIVWWIRAEEPATLVGDLAALATELNLPIAADGKAEDVAAAARKWLEQTDLRWLLIFDNAESPRDLAPHLPRLGDGRVLITSRLHAWNGLASPLDLHVLDSGDAVRFLLRRTGRTDEHGASAIVQQVDGLPLALEQAAAYIIEHGASFARYLELFKANASRLLGEQHATAITNAAVTTTWLVSIRAVAEHAPAAVDLLSLCACFAPDLIPIDVIRAQTVEMPEPLAIALTDPLTATDTVGVLYRYSLVDVIDDNTISIHRLVQFAVTENMLAEDRAAWADAAVRLMRRAYPFTQNDPGTWRESERLMPHALAACAAATAAHTDAPAVSYLLDRVASYLQKQGQFSWARELIEQALASDLGTYGSDHPLVAAHRTYLGSVLHDLGNLAEAKTELEQALASVLATHGSNHSNTLGPRISLGSVLKGLGDLIGAKTHYEEALENALATYGPNNPDVAAIRNSLGDVLQEIGDLAGAKGQFEQALESALATSGPDKPLVAAIRNNLGRVLEALGDLTGAKDQLEQALESDLATFGPDHPDVATRRNNLASVLRGLGDLPGAKALYEQALESAVVAYPNNPIVAGIRSNLGTVLGELGELPGAKAQLEQALESDLATFGPDHPDVATRRNNLGCVLRDLGDLVGAKNQLEQALESNLATFGPYHPTVAATRSNLGSVLSDLGDLAGATTVYEQALSSAAAILKTYGPDYRSGAGRTNLQDLIEPTFELMGAKTQLEQMLERDLATYGPDHPTIAASRSALGGALGALGELPAAKSQLEQALQSDLATYGPDHPTVAVTRNKLGYVLRSLGDLRGAKTQYEQALESNLDTYGPNHPSVATIRNDLGSVLLDLGDLEGAKSEFEQALQSSLAIYRPDHPSIIDTRNDLGLVLQALGDLAGAKTQHELALRSDLVSYRPDHPRIAIRRHNLAMVLRAVGDLAGAKTLYEQALATELATFGPDHLTYTVAATRNNLGNVLQELGDLDGARDQFEAALAICKANKDEAGIASIEGRLSTLDSASSDGNHTGARQLPDRHRLRKQLSVVVRRYRPW